MANEAEIGMATTLGAGDTGPMLNSQGKFATAKQNMIQSKNICYNIMKCETVK